MNQSLLLQQPKKNDFIENFKLIDQKTKKVVFKGKIKEAIKSPFSEKYTQEIDFLVSKKRKISALCG
ncbi:cellulase N-terminal Ig-like domain-containing protein [Flectobacillus sp. BAB-3569]|uniref:cellulase N-terminal Ig-like domain-containing protein n=1 Tax=Flectobacillus sp. BAB-3569 TaxID=1509483 RepID=UPI00159590DE